MKCHLQRKCNFLLDTEHAWTASDKLCQHEKVIIKNVPVTHAGFDIAAMLNIEVW